MVIANTKVHRIELHQIKKSHKMYKIVDELCFKSKNLYNYANYIIRQEFINNNKYIGYYDMKKELKTHEPFIDLGSQAAQQTLAILDRSWKSFFVAIKDWSRNKNKYLGKPNLPKYKNKNGRQVVILSNIQFKIVDNYIRFSWKPFREFLVPTKVTGKPVEIRFVPKGNSYNMELVYQTEIPESYQVNNHIAGIDIGLNNLATVSNNIGVKPFIINGKPLKSMNHYYNKKKASIDSQLKICNKARWSNKLDSLNNKRFNKVKLYLHKTSRYIVNWCVANKIDTLVIGHNKEWKQGMNMRKKVNQNFAYIPYNILISQLKYKCESVGIKFIETEESYTSGTSFLDNELPTKDCYNKNRRVKRGLFKSNDGKLINADLNGSYQIVRKVFPKAFDEGIQEVHLHPVRINLI